MSADRTAQAGRTASSSTEREREHYLEAMARPPPARTPIVCMPRNDTQVPDTVPQLVAGSSSTPITKTLRFSPSLSLSFNMSCSDCEEDDDLRGLGQDDLGSEFDEIARRAREESLLTSFRSLFAVQCTIAPHLVDGFLGPECLEVLEFAQSTRTASRRPALEHTLDASTSPRTVCRLSRLYSCEPLPSSSWPNTSFSDS